MKKSIGLINPKFRRVIISGEKIGGYKRRTQRFKCSYYTIPFLKQDSGDKGSDLIVIF